MRLVAVRVLLLSAIAALLLVVDPGALETTSSWLWLVLAGATFALATYTAQTSPPRRAILTWTWTTAAATVLLALPQLGSANAHLGPGQPLNQLRWTDLRIVITELPDAVTLIGAPAAVGITSALLMRALTPRRRTRAAPTTSVPRTTRRSETPVRASHS